MEELSLRIRVRVTSEQGADAVCARIAKDIDPRATSGRVGLTRLAGGGFAVPVISMERADGIPLGLEYAFEEYWDGTHCDGDEGGPGEKLSMRCAFFAGVRAAE